VVIAAADTIGPFAQRAEFGIVIQRNGNAPGFFQVGLDRISAPAGHDGWGIDHPGFAGNRSGDANPQSTYLADGKLVFFEQIREQTVSLLDAFFWTIRYAEGRLDFVDHLRAEIGQDDGKVRGAHIDAGHVAAPGVDIENNGWAAVLGVAGFGFPNDFTVQQIIDNRCHRGPAQIHSLG
jgi:hypothetical protein